MKLPTERARVAQIAVAAMSADVSKRVPGLRYSRPEQKHRPGLRVLGKDGGIVEIAADVTATATVGIVAAVMAARASRRVSLWLRWQRARMRDLLVRRVKAMRLAKALRGLMVDAGGVDGVDGVVAVTAVRMDRR